MFLYLNMASLHTCQVAINRMLTIADGDTTELRITLSSSAGTRAPVYLVTIDRFN